MKRMLVSITVLATIIPAICAAQVAQTIHLVNPDTAGGKPIMQLLKERRTSRSFSHKKLSSKAISNLLWAAFGINRPDGRRTAPSAMNWQEIDLYVAMEKGVYIYEAQSHSLKQIVAEDLRSMTGTQGFVKDAPINIVYVADMSRVKRVSEENAIVWTAADCGFIAQNVYLFCASEGLACVVRGAIDKPELSRAMKLRPNQKIILAQTVGYPK
ncbi:MAG: SagB/ThcOx family dehydrogenase [Bacteroidetes bacterium]|nr:SagB/ThcOx family dehydrogenase [Bacteroidota bacterium]